jgi:oligopeptide/dipeptide ABC transporter ATP-binding protein
LDVRNLSIHYPSPRGPISVIRDLSFQLAQGELLALVGETGCGKSTLALSIVGLLESRNQVESGSILFERSDLYALKDDEWRRIRGLRIGMIFQDARGALNPVLTIGDHLLEALRAHQRLSRHAAWQRAIVLLADAGISDPDFCMRRYPLELSGGACQRVGIALGICHQPRLLIADEPTSALDPTLNAQILRLLKRMSQIHNLAILLISHDLALVSAFADRVAVMYGGTLVETGSSREIFSRAAHPYTRALLESQLLLNRDRKGRLLTCISGTPPTVGQVFAGCPFAPRCSLAETRCRSARPAPAEISKTHWAACVKLESAAEHNSDAPAES